MLNEPRKEMGETGAELDIEGQGKSPFFLQDDYDMANTNVVRSEGYATMFVDPDIIEFFLRADSIKDSAEEVKTSISKRIDYLLQVVKSKIQGEKNISVHELLDKRDDMYTMSAEILVKCGSLQKYEEIRNIVVEKLGGTVFVSEPRHYHTHRCLQDASLSCLAAATISAIK
ncbi:interleukin-1 receptor-associated kinase 1-binding protein 1 homolog isoform X3 [Schistocerca cancellata]|uniref:interleukin-1 receptor-associated kinase 1-binding protein 1 homolog isoform X3 n=1 Tax=Schistocerca cancellata TaxID=274614 RepID=UPI002118C8DE|nr:interleukin-1 receptor-associated kinase 1-binding protein 1 homolog isoform X3 [Schistocerca cancellata]